MIRLERTVWARVASGALLQPWLTIMVLMVPLGVGGAAVRGDPANVVRYLAIEALLVVIWAFGLTAHAVADGDGVRWRYYLPHHVRWSDVEQVRLTFRSIAWTGRYEVHVRAGGRDHFISPACGLFGRGHRRFGLELVQLARSHGVPAAVEWGPGDVRDGMR